MAYNFNVTLREGKWEVKIDTAACYGYFEHDDYGEGGGLWFEVESNELENTRLELTDFDGCTELPKGVAKALREAGYIVDEIFD